MTRPKISKAVIILFCYFIVLPCYATQTVIISEVFYDTPGITYSEFDEEWIELYNTTSTVVDIGGYKIFDSGNTPYTIEQDILIDPGQTLIFARDGAGFYNLYQFYPDFGDFTRSLSNSGDLIRLVDDADNQIDYVAWESDSWTSVYADEGNSIQRQSFDSGPGAWLSNQTATPGQHFIIPEPGTFLLLGFGFLSLGMLGFHYNRHRKNKILNIDRLSL